MSTMQRGFLVTGPKEENTASLRDSDFDGPANTTARRPTAKETAAAGEEARTVAAANTNRAAVDGEEGDYKAPRHTSDGNWDVPVNPE